MFRYYLALSFTSLRARYWMATLMIVTLAVGIGVSVASFALIRAASVDPVPGKSNLLYVPAFDGWSKGPKTAHPSGLWTYIDAKAALQRRDKDVHVTALYPVNPVLSEQESTIRPRRINGHAVNADFFTSVDAVFQFGSTWRPDVEARGARQVVISSQLNATLFRGKNSVHRALLLDGQQYQIAGVLNDFDPAPKFYDLDSGAFATRDDVFVPLTTAMQSGMTSVGNVRCRSHIDNTMDALGASDCVWLSMLVELSTPEAVRDFDAWLHNYSGDQMRLGRTRDETQIGLFGLKTWMTNHGAVPDDVIQLQLVSLGILLVCCANLMALLLASFLYKEREVGVRRALGATRSAITQQLLTEASLIGLLSGVVGTLLSVIGIAFIRAFVPPALSEHVSFDITLIAVALVLAVGAAVLSGVYPALRAAKLSPIQQIKAS